MPQPQSAWQTTTPVADQDEHHLGVLEILHNVLAALTALATTVGVALIVVGYPMMNQTRRPGQPLPLSPHQDPQLAGMVLVVAGAAFSSLCVVHALVIAYIGRMIARRRRRSLCTAFSIFHLMNFPFGTALSIYALIVLRRLKRKEDGGRKAEGRRQKDKDGAMVAGRDQR